MESAYDKKFEEMQKYIPFLESMIKRLENSRSPDSTNPRQAQLDKIRSLRDLLLNKNSRMKMDNVLKCEQVLVNLYAKVEQKDTSVSNTKRVTEEKPTSSKDKSDLETVRNKLKTVARIQDGVETLPEIARANDIELDFTGSKEPALFQRRPNKSVNSPVCSQQKSPSYSNKSSPHSQRKQNYTRVLASPDNSPRRWSTPEKSSEKPLYSRRSPPKIISTPLVGKKGKKKSKSSKARKANDLNITLNVPQESLLSLNTDDILPRIINCNDGDVDIDTLRELRTQILGELKQTGKNDDISDLILKSYKIKSKPKKKVTGKNSKDVEEGELSDSESEAIESIYGSLPVTDKEKKSSTLLKSKEQRKIQISLVISDKVESNISNKPSEPGEVIDLESELEMCSENENDKHIISVDTDTPLTSPKQLTVKKKIGKETEIVAECITVEDDNQITEVFSKEGTSEPKSQDSHKKNSMDSKKLPDVSQIEPIIVADSPKKEDKCHTKTSNNSDNHSESTENVQKVAEQRPKFVANFYKPIDYGQCEIPASSTDCTSNLKKNENILEIQKDCFTEPAQPLCATPNNANNSTEKHNDDNHKDIVTTISENKTTNLNTNVEKGKQDDCQNIPLLNEPTVPPKAKADVLSEIDILQALKNEILSESIPILGTEVGTPALHQPKLTKVSNAQEVLPMKKISIEKYKEKVATSTNNPLFLKKRNRRNRNRNLRKKQSLKLTEKECERFNFPIKLAFHEDDDVDNLSDDDYITDEKDDSLDSMLGLDYGGPAPKSPDNESINNVTTPPVIIPTDPKLFEASEVKKTGDIDMRSVLPPLQPPIPLLSIKFSGCGTVSPSPVHGIDKSMNEIHTDPSKTVVDINRISTLDPRKRRDLNVSAVNSPNPYIATNPEITSRSFANVVGAPNMTPRRTVNMTPSYMPSIPQLRTPNARTFEMTPSHQTFELEEPSTRKHVYAPSFPMCDSRERESSVSKDGPVWEINKIDPRNRRGRWEEPNKHTGGPNWEVRDPWKKSGQSDGSYTPRREDSHTSNYDTLTRTDKYMTYDRRDSYSTIDCPTTPIPSFGWSECPSTPGSSFGRQETPMTPSHPFGRSDCPTTPVHPFGRADCPPTPSGGFGRIDVASNYSYSRSECPTTPSHPFGRSECPPTPSHSFGRNDRAQTPTHQFGRSECPRTPSHPFGRSDSVPYNRPDNSYNSNQKYLKDPRLNRRLAEHETNSYNENDTTYRSERDRTISSYKSQSKHYNSNEKSKNYERERRIGRNDRDQGDRYAKHCDRNSHDPSLPQSKSKETEKNRLYSRNRESRDGNFSFSSKDYDDKRNERERSVGRTSSSKQCIERERPMLRALSVGRITDKELNKDKILFQSDAGKHFTINTSVKSTFQDFLPSGKPIQIFEYSSDTRRQRAASVGRSLLPKNVYNDRTQSLSSKENYSTYAQDRNNKFKRASSVGRELSKSVRTLQEVKADFEAFRSKHTRHRVDTNKESKKYINQLSSYTRKDTSNEERDTNQSKQNYSPRKNYHDSRRRKENPIDTKNRYKIDRRTESCDARKSGIVYSNDNIAKGTIMGSGFGVKNYKIPKLKRVEPEITEVKATDKGIAESAKNDEINKNIEGTDKKPTHKDLKQADKVVEQPSVKTNVIKNKKESKTTGKISDESEAIETRSKKKIESDKLEDDIDDAIIKTRKLKKTVIYESDSDSTVEQNLSKKVTQNQDSKLVSPSKTVNTNKNIVSSITTAETERNAIEETLDSNFGLDDIFSETLEQNSQIDNMKLNALIENLDKDLSSAQVPNDTFDAVIDKMMETINSPESNSLGNISKVINKDLNKGSESQHPLTVDNLLDERSLIMSDSIQHHPSAESQCVELNFSKNSSQPTDITNMDVELPATQPKTVIEQNIPKEPFEGIVMLNVNEAIVSTTEIDQEINENKIKTREEYNNLDQSAPDSTNVIHCELSSDVTSTNDAAEKESEMQSQSQKEKLNSIESLLSILQDKSKIKELMTMLKGQGDEKIKKKLEKLSQFVSDEEDGAEILDNREDSDTIAETEKPTEKETLQTIEVQTGDEISRYPDKEIETDMPIPVNMVSNEDHTEEVINTTNNTSVDNNESNLKPDDLSRRINVHTTTERKLQNDETNDTKKIKDDDFEDDEPLVKSAKKNIKSKSGRCKKKTASKLTTRAMPAKKGVSKRMPAKRELQKLQEDIKEMFMRDEILNATGIRMCRLAKMNEMASKPQGTDSEPVVVLEKVEEVRKKDQPIKIRKKPGPKPKPKPIKNITKSPEADKKMSKPKIVPKNKPGPKPKTKSTKDITDPFEFDTDSIADTSTTKDSDDDSSGSENESLASSRSFGSSEVLIDMKKKSRRKRRGIGGWQSGVIKPKNRKKKDQKQEIQKKNSPIVKPLKTITIPDLNCFTDKSYCFQKGVFTYDCRLCVYSGSDIVIHYKKEHPHTEIPLSRMDQKTAELAIEQCEQRYFQSLTNISSNKYTCRFCHKEFSNTRNLLETFFWHIVSNHTGEFKNLCSECVNVTRCPFNLDIPPPPKDGGQLIGYLCQKCNFTQISLENLKTHVHVRHDDQETEVFTINLAVMSNKAMKAMLRKAHTQNQRVMRNLRSNPSVADSSVIRDEHSDDSESSDDSSEYNQSGAPITEKREQNQQEVVEEQPKMDQMKAKLTFENDDPSDDASVKVEQEDHDESSHLDDTLLAESAKSSNESHRGNSDEIVDYPHFKVNYTESGGKEYVCCINGNDSHYKTALLISMKKHIQTKHSEKWDGYCCVCKVIVTLQGVQSDFRDCLSHFLDKHLDDFPVLEKGVEYAREEIEIAVPPETNASDVSNISIINTSHAPVVSAVPSASSPAVPTRFLTPPIERTASPSYIAVRPLSELIAKELPPQIETPTALPRIEAVVSLGKTIVPAQPSPSYPTNSDSYPLPEKPFSYEEKQAEVMSKKHQVVLDVMMSKENLVRAFKCAGRFCSFTTDSPEDALMHASTHRRVGGEGALDCAYCNYDACENAIDMVMHVFKEHSRCQYCCPMCFYRAAASRLVSEHYTKAHVGATQLRTVLRSNAAVTPPKPGHSTGLLSRDVAVKHFICNHDDGACNFKTYLSGKFIEHLQIRHANALAHPCNLCPTAASSPTELVLHLRSHGLKLYQCTWCVHGANNETELLAHVASKHPASQPQAYVRVITSKEGGQRVLPLAYFNKVKVPIENVTPNTMKENPVREAERSIELEKLIAHTMFDDGCTNQSSSKVDDVSQEEPVEIPAESLPNDEDIEVPAADELPIPDQNVSSENNTGQASVPAEKSNTSTTLTVPEPPEVKAEPNVAPNFLSSEDIICLDSDEESDATEALVTSTDEASNIEKPAQKISTEVTRNSVTDDVSITKVTEEASSKSSDDPNERNKNVQIENVIDVSDEDSTPEHELGNRTKSYIVQNVCIYKCPICFKISKTMQALRKHVKRQCEVDCVTPKCPHNPCEYVAPNLNKLLVHYKEAHSDKKTALYHCDICNALLNSITGAKLHIRSVHKVNNYIVHNEVSANGANKYVIKDAGLPTEPVRISGRKTSTEIQRYQADLGGRQRKPSTETKKRYGIADIDKLPINPILDTEVFCDLCEFGSKVRLNMVRHLQQHAGNVPVPHTAPVNPVPHLETNEMHFDKMVNLASSSIASRTHKPRAEEPAIAVKIPPSESSRYPKYVPERERYTCGATDCSYISVDMAMFRCHWETLHANEKRYRCVHCPPTQALTTSIPLNAARILGHLRMHDVCLYACSSCSYYHYKKNLIEKHISESHKEGAVKIVREEYQPEPSSAPPASAPTMDLKPWQCGLCDYSSMLRQKVVYHCATEHHSKMQFKCGHCLYKSSEKEYIVKHLTNNHSEMPKEVFYYFYREGSVQDEGEIPLWQQQRQKLGIDERDLMMKSEPTPEPVPETPVMPISIRPAPAIDLNNIKAEKPEDANATELSREELCLKFGKLCEPDGIKYKCCLCNSVRKNSRETMQCHLYEELNYRRWECVICSYKAFHKSGLNDHMASEHSRQFNPPRALPVDVNIEKWVEVVLDHQSKIIEHNLSNLSVQKIQTERATVNPASPKKTETPNPATKTSDSELQNAFGEFGAPKNSQYACPKCEFTTKDEATMVTHLESELTKIRWGCTICNVKFQTYHEAQFHCKSAHTGQPTSPKETIREPSLRAGWVKAVITSQRQFIKCISETNREPSPEKNSEDSDQNENSLLVALYDEPAHIEERPAAKRQAGHNDSDDERLVIDEPQAKKPNERQCPYCDYNMRNSRYLREHILKEHYNMKPYKCYYCTFKGTRHGVTNHCSSHHYDQPKRFVIVEVPNTLPTDGSTKISEPATSTSTSTLVDPDTAKISKRDCKDDEKRVCLYCEKSVPESEMDSHTHGTEKAEFAKRGEVVVKCCKCLVLRLSLTSLQEHFDACHPGEKVLDNYAYFKLQVDTREILCCGHCYKKFKFLRDLKVHHSTSHTSLNLSYNSIPFSHNLYTEGDTEVCKRKAEDIAGPPTKRIAVKSTTKLPSAIAKKSTAKPVEPVEASSSKPSTTAES